MRIKENGHADAGFTLIELVVTFVIMLMLTSLSVAGLMSYQDYADYKRQNSYAQTLFLAAQTKLMAYSERGQLEALQEVSTQELPLHLVKIANGVVADRCETVKGNTGRKWIWQAGSIRHYMIFWMNLW